MVIRSYGPQSITFVDALYFIISCELSRHRRITCRHLWPSVQIFILLISQFCFAFNGFSILFLFSLLSMVFYFVSFFSFGRYPLARYGCEVLTKKPKLQPKKRCTFLSSRKINDNAYKLDSLKIYDNISITINVTLVRLM